MASLISPEIKKQYFDSNGDPLNGGKLYVYEAGTTTPVVSYTDAAESSTNANPIILDSRGEFDGLWLRVGSYKFVLKDSDDVTIWTEDSIVIRDVGSELDDLNTEITNINTVIATDTRNSRIESGEMSALSSQSNYLVPIGSSNQIKVLGTSTDLVYYVEGVRYTITSDFVASGLVSPPVSNNTALVNDTNLADQDFSRTLGEFGTGIPYDTAGSEITALNGEIAAFKINNGASSEYFIAKVDNTNSQLIEAQRGAFWGSDENPIERIAFSNNDTLTLMKLTWLYLKSNGTILASYDGPTYSTTAPTAVSDGTMWFDIANDKWKRWNSTTFEEVTATPLGLCIQDENGNTVGARPEYFYSENSEINTAEIVYKDSTTLKSRSRENIVAVLGNILRFNNSYLECNIVSHIETGEAEAASTWFYFYIKETGDKVISPHAPHDMRGRLKGFYHPYQTWRYVGKVFNNSSSDFEASSVESSPEQISNAQEGTVLSISGNHTISNKEEVVLADATSAGFTINLPSAVISKGREITIIKKDASTNIVTIGGGLTYQLFGQNSALTVVSEGTSWKVKSYPSAPMVTIIEDQKSSGTSGGTSSATPVARDLNTLSGDNVAMKITIDGTDGFQVGVTGEYLIEWRCPCYDGGGGQRHKSALYDETNTEYLKPGSCGYSSTSGGAQTDSIGYYRGTVEAGTVLAIWHEAQAAVANGWGQSVGGSLTIDSGAAANEVYTSVKVTRII